MADAIYFNLPKASPLDTTSIRRSASHARKDKRQERHEEKRQAVRAAQDAPPQWRDDARMVEYAAVAGLSVSEYMRRLFLGGRPIIASTDDQMIRDLRRMGGLLKLLITKSPEVTEEIRETLTSIRQAIERLAART